MYTASAARTVLADCRRVHTLLEDCEDPEIWRIHWVAAVALIRMVGHVLHKVDGRDSNIRQASSSAFERWKQHREEHSIFWEFIREERNLVLKQYQIGVDLSEEIPIAVSDPAGADKRPMLFGLRENLYRPMAEGQWEGEDARDLYADAIDWWEKQLLEIEYQASSIRG